MNENLTSNMKLLWMLLISLSATTATICPTGDSCPGAETCCLLSSGEYGCCPYSDAVCCSDREHCCPYGYKCSVYRCIREENATFSKTALVKNDNVICPNMQEHCPNKFTCCRAEQEEQYGCCPIPDGVCCEDNVHCCPSGATCDLNKQQCLLSGISFPLIRKTKSIPSSSSDLLLKTTPTKPVNTICPDPHYSCQDGDTCCRTPRGVWTCCIYPYGTCCSDGLHCCPYGMSCLSSLHCVKGNISLPTKPSPLSVDNSQGAIVCPDKTQCSDGSTCCKISGKIYGCCPLPDAVCCSDERYCCPHGYTCNTQSKTCSNGVEEIPWFTKTPSF